MKECSYADCILINFTTDMNIINFFTLFWLFVVVSLNLLKIFVDSNIHSNEYK